MTGNPKLVSRDGEDPVVETCDRDLVEHENDFVDNVGAIEPLACSHAGARVEGIPASTVTVHNGLENC